MVEFKYIANEERLYFSINSLVYPVKVIMKAAYIYTSNFYICFDYESDTHVSAQFKAKDKISQNDLEKCAGEFYNELLNQRLRFDIQNKTKDLRQLILGRALYTECIETKESFSPSVESNTSEEFSNIANDDDDYLKDNNKIGQSWYNGMRYIKDETE